jgi:tocopherol O-methyltransferase
VWSLESGEHMPDKTGFLRECCRVLRPGGVFILATWCHRPVQPFAPPLTEDEQRHLAKIYQVYCLPHVISLPEYEAIARSLPFEQLRTADWSAEVAPFWDVVMASALSPQAVWGLVNAGWGTIKAALSLNLMARGYRRGLVRYGLLCATK